MPLGDGGRLTRHRRIAKRDLVLRVRPEHIPLIGGSALARASFFAALLAVIMLVIGGAPAFASSEPCNPCPPDCPMMMSQAGMDHHDNAPKQNPAESPCKAMVVCQVAMAMPVLPGETTFATLTSKSVRQPLVNERFAMSRPPDRDLRPPISL